MADYPHVMLTPGNLPAPWREANHVWLDMAPGAQISLPGIGFCCQMQRSASGDRFELELHHSIAGQDHMHRAELGAIMDVSSIVGYPCVVIPRAIRPCTAAKPAAVMLEIMEVRREAA